jgi:hypothetical protein
MVGMFRDFYINYCLTTTSKEFIVVKFVVFYVASKALFQLRFVDFLCGVERAVFYEVVSMFLALKVVFLQNISIFFS